jgi:hypothetical protein
VQETTKRTEGHAGHPADDGGRWWKATAEAASWYRERARFGYGGPQPVRLDAEPTGVLDCRGHFWQAVEKAGLFDREDTDPGDAPAEVVASRRLLFAAHGYRWVVFDDDDPTGSPSWFFVGEGAAR